MSVSDEIQAAIEAAIPGARASVAGGDGHYEIEVISEAFEGKRLIEKQRMVYKAIAHLMNGEAAPVHAVDRMVCRTA